MSEELTVREELVAMEIRDDHAKDSDQIADLFHGPLSSGRDFDWSRRIESNDSDRS